MGFYKNITRIIDCLGVNYSIKQQKKNHKK